MWTAAGAVLVTRRPLCRLGAIVLAGTVVGAATIASASLATDASWTGIGRDVAAVVATFGTLLLPAVALHVLLALPVGRLGEGAAAGWPARDTQPPPRSPLGWR